MRVLHLSDLHIPRSLGSDTHGVDARAVLARLLHDCRRVDDLDLVVVSGDIADDGSPEGYIDALALVGDFARDRGAAQVWCTGNHDAREAFAAVLGSGHLDASGRDAGALAPSAIGERAAISEVAGVRVITLDSLVPGQVAGRLSAAQLAWLRQVLAEPAPAGSVVVLHHPPVSVSAEWAAASLRDPSALADALRGSDVQAVLCGHVHAQITGQLAGVPVWVGPGVVTRIDLSAPSAIVRAVRGAAATLVDLGGPNSPLLHVLHARDPRAGEQVYLASATTWQYVATEDQEAAGTPWSPHPQ
jgi:3',5'-cyclic-AMP phosphodiesterase